MHFKKKIDISISEEMYAMAEKIARMGNITMSEAFAKAFKLGVPLCNAILECPAIITQEENESEEDFEERVRNHYKPFDCTKTIAHKEATILLSYIRFLESCDGHPQRFFFRDQRSGRIIATPETIDQLRDLNSPVYQNMAHDIICAERQWVARWLCNTEDVALGRKKGSFDALKWIMERDHKWTSSKEAAIDFERLSKLFGIQSESAT